LTSENKSDCYFLRRFKQHLQVLVHLLPLCQSESRNCSILRASARCQARRTSREALQR